MKNEPKLTRNRLIRYAVQGLVFGVLGSTAVLLYYTKPATLTLLKQFDWKYGILCFFVVAFAWFCNGLRIFLLCRSLGYSLRYRQALCVSLSMEFGIAATPAGMGGAVIRLSFLRLAGVPVGHATSMLATDVALDALFFLLLLPFAVTSILQNPKFIAALPWKEPNQYGPLLLGLLAVAALLFALTRFGAGKALYRRLTRWERLRRYRPRARGRWLKWKRQKELHRIKQGLAFLFHMRKGILLLAFLVASMQWCCRYGILSLLLFAFQVPNNPFLIFMLQGILFTVSLLIVLPGGGGGVEVLMALVLRQIIPPPLIGIVILLWRFFTYYLYLFGGGAMFLWALSHLREIFPKTSDGPMPDPLEEETSAQPL